MARSTPHDPMCWDSGTEQAWPYVCHACLLIAKIRADERVRWQPRTPAQPHHAAYCWCTTCVGQAVGPT